MTPDRWEQVSVLYRRALELRAEERDAFVFDACGNDQELLRELQSLVLADGKAGNFLRSGAISDAARMLAEQKRIPRVGSSLAHYRVLSRLGEGGMGEVYLAEDTRLKRRVALKVLPDAFVQDRERVRRFEHEARAASALNHPNIVTIFEIGEADSTRFIVTEFIDGDTLREFQAQSTLSVSDVLKVSVQIVSALTSAHSAGIVHRDVKPENIMIRKDGLVKVLDFGLAKLVEATAAPEIEESNPGHFNTTPGLVLGTVNYMSPEQARGKEVDGRSDIFSFGVVLYETLAGRSPFVGETTSDLIAAILTYEPEPASSFDHSIPPELDRIIGKTLAKEREDRYLTADALLADLRLLEKRLEFATVGREFEVPLAMSARALAAEDIGTSPRFAAEAHNSIAVLPFANLSPDPENEYFCDGLAEELLNALARVEGLKVPARISAFSFKNKNAPISEIGRALKVNSVLEGSVRKSGDRVRIAVQLVNVSDGYQLWSERYDRQTQDIFDVQDEIARAIVSRLRMALGGAPAGQLVKATTDNIEAYEHYLKGRVLLARRGSGVLQARAHLSKAVELDPQFASAWSGLADAYTVLGYFGFARGKEVMPLALEAAKRATLLDPHAAEGHTALACAKLLWERDNEAAEREFLRALELDPHYVQCRCWFAIFYLQWVCGKLEEGISQARRALEDDPLSAFSIATLANCLLTAGQYEEAIEKGQMAVERDPDSFLAHWVLGLCYKWAGRYEDAVKVLDSAALISGRHPFALSALAATYAKWGKPAEARAVHAELAARASREYISSAVLAISAAASGDINDALDLAQRAYDEHEPTLVLFAGHFPEYHPLREDPRFFDILRRLRLPSDIELISNSGTRPAEQLPNQKSESSMRKTRALGFVAAAVFMIAAAVFVYFFRPGLAEKIDSIAVLPFANASGDSNSDYLCDGVTESIINSLSQVQSLRVIPRNTVFRYTAGQADPTAVAKALHVRAVLTGRVTQRGDSIVIQTELIDTKENKEIWGEQYERKLSGLVSVQHEIAREISTSLRLKLSIPEQNRVARQYTENPDAYQSYLKGRFYWNRRTTDSMRKAISYFQQAIDQDPGYASAYAGLADSYALSDLYGRGAGGRDVFRYARTNAEKALEMDETLAEARATVAYVKYYYDWDWSGAEKEFQKAIESDPNNATAHQWYAEYLFYMARFDESISQLEIARTLDPLSLVINTELGSPYFYMRQYDKAIDEYRSVAEMDPHFFLANYCLALSYGQKSMYDEAITLLGGNKNVSAAVAYFYAAAGRRREAERMLKRVMQVSRNDYFSPYLIASVHSALGEKDTAFAQLEEAYRDRDERMVMLKVDPHLDVLRPDPRFKALLHRIGLDAQ
jgi:TolB-like protein/Tfp pilus assembly protein PilF